MSCALIGGATNIGRAEALARRAPVEVIGRNSLRKHRSDRGAWPPCALPYQKRYDIKLCALSAGAAGDSLLQAGI